MADIKVNGQIYEGVTAVKLALSDNSGYEIYTSVSGSNTDEVVKGLIDGTTSFDIVDDKITSVRESGFMHVNVENIVLSNVTSLAVNAFKHCKMRSVSMPSLVEIKANFVFNSCKNLVTVDMPKLETLNAVQCFSECTSLKSISFPALKGQMGSGNVFRSDTALEFVDLGHVTFLRDNVFNGCTSLTKLVLRSETLVELAYTDCFTGCGTTINVYVPSALVSEYPNATNWSDVTGATLNFVALEGSEYE